MKKVLLFVIVLFLVSFSFALDIDVDSNQNDTNEIITSPTVILSNTAINIKEQIREISKKVVELDEGGFSLARIRDEFYLVRQEFDYTVEIEKKGFEVDYSKTFSRLEAVRKSIDLAYLVRDEIDTLKAAVLEVEDEIDTTQVYEIILFIDDEFNDERYEKAQELVEQAYEKLIELQSVEAKASVAYQAARQNIEGFIEDQWFNIVVILLGAIVIYLLFRKKVKCFILKKKIRVNEDELIVLKDEIKSAQKKYFIDGKLPEGEYTIKVSFFSEKIRELHRTNAVFLEELEETKVRKKLKK